MLIPRCSRLTSLLAIALFATGCGSKSDPAKIPHSDNHDGRRKSVASSPVAEARRALQTGDAGLAVQIIQRRLLSHPDDMDAVFVAAQAEAARGNHTRAAAYAESIDVTHSRLGKSAAILRAEQEMLAGDYVASTLTLTQLVNRFPSEPTWKHLLWESLNRQSRRQEASSVASALTQSGNASLEELQSLIRRGHAFPIRLKDGENPEDRFSDNAARARWLFSKEDFVGALQRLQEEQGDGVMSADSYAFYGRLLAETQSFEQMGPWHAQGTEEVRSFGDYWAALGIFLIHVQEYEAATRVLLEAVSRNPTDRSCYQRLGRSLASLGRHDSSKQAYLRGIYISESEAMLQDHLDDPANPQICRQLSDKLLQLGRPFEMMQWIEISLPPADYSQRQLLAAQRRKLLGHPELEQMTSGEATVELNPQDFQYERALEQALGSSSPTVAISKPEHSDPLAIPSLCNVAAEVGADIQWYHDTQIDLSSISLYESVGGGAGVIDYDLDGWPDVYMAQGAAGPPDFQATKSNVMLRNMGGEFRSATEAAGLTDLHYSVGIATGDVNQDGFADIFLGNLGSNRLFINNGDGTFRDASATLGKHPDRFTTSVAIADIDGDTLPDLYACNYIEMEGVLHPPKIQPDGRETHVGPLGHFADADRWFRATADGRFEMYQIDTTVAELGTALGVVVSNFDSAPGNETFVANDARPNHFLVHSTDDGLVNQADVNGLAYGFHGSANACMGIATGDFNRDGMLDLQVANYIREANDLYLQADGGGFVDGAARYGLATLTYPFLGFGCKAIDIDRNGWLDLIITNGHIRDNSESGDPFQMPPLFLMHQGDGFAAVEVDDTSGYWNGEYLGRAVVMLDFDRDYAIDFLVTHLDQPTALLRNQTRTPGHWIQLELIGTDSERDAIGARVTATAAGEEFTAWVVAGDGYLCSDEPVLDIGLGRREKVERLEVVWPSGTRQEFNDIAVDRRYLLIENESEAVERR